MNYKQKFIEIPFGAKDSELKGWEYTIPDGMEAIVKDGKVIVREKKSEDERIRKFLVELLSSGTWKKEWPFQPNECVAYLEKQKEQKPNIELIQQSWYMEGYTDGEFKREPMWNLVTGKGGPKYEKNEKYGQPLEQKPAENVSKEEYVKRFKTLCDAYEIKLPNREYDIYHLCDDLSKLSIDSGKQKPAEWSEEDENIIETLIRELRLNAQFEFAVEKLGLDYIQTLTVLDKCRRLYPRPSWKPSEEQMGAIRTAIDVLRGQVYDGKELYPGTSHVLTMMLNYFQANNNDTEI